MEDGLERERAVTRSSLNSSCLEQGHLLRLPEDAPAPCNWATTARTSLESVTTRYRANIPPSLHSVCVFIKPAEKIAVIGWTVSGKSSFILSLLGMMQITIGCILVDNINLLNIEDEPLRDIH
ncbi:ABC transporter C family member [Paramyrothecium foliicola]|nr:ABC transporter C family member [Paramyrothecium foliicola]